MRIERTKNAGRNILFGGILKVYQIAVPFVMRTAMIYFMGIQYLGLNSLFTSILQVLNLAELGVASAMVYSMYKPIALDDKTTICALMKLFRFCYRVIGVVIAVIGIALIPILPKLVKSDIPSNINIYILYILNLGTTVLSYWLFAYKNCLLSAHQRTDVTSRITIVTITIQYALQFCAVCILKNYYLFVIIALATQALTNISTAIVVTKMYPQYSPHGEVDATLKKDIACRVRDLFTAKVGGVIVNSADTVVISAFLGLTVLAVYQNYFYIVTSIIGVVTIVFTACTAGIGNSLIVETKEKNYRDLIKFTFLISWLSGFCATCLLCLYQPFMELWVGVNLQLGFSAVICFVLYYYIYEINQLLNTFKDAAGIWHKDRFRPLITAATNLTLNLILVRIYGIYGVLLSTVISMLFVGMPWLLHNLFSELFAKHLLSEYIKKLMFYTFVSALGCVLTYFICSQVDLSAGKTLLIRGLICCIIPNLVFFLFYREKKEFDQCLQLLINVTNGKLKVLNNLRR